MDNNRIQRETRILLYVIAVVGIIGGALVFASVVFGWEAVLLVLMRMWRALGL